MKPVSAHGPCPVCWAVCEPLGVGQVEGRWAYGYRWGAGTRLPAFETWLDSQLAAACWVSYLVFYFSISHLYNVEGKMVDTS